MNLAFEHGYLRDLDDEAIKNLPVEFHPTSIKAAFGYIKTHRTVPYVSINFDEGIDVLAIDFGSHTEFCYVWDITGDEMKGFIGTSDEEDPEETEKKRFAYEVLYRIKQMQTIPYDVAVAFSKILGEE